MNTAEYAENKIGQPRTLENDIGLANRLHPALRENSSDRPSAPKERDQFILGEVGLARPSSLSLRSASSISVRRRGLFCLRAS